MSLIIDGWLHDDYGGRTYSTLHILKHKHPGTLNTHLLKMDVWWFPAISQVKVWFIIQLKQPIQNPGCLVRLPGMWPSVGGRFNHFQAFKSLVVFRGAQPVSQLAVCFSSGPDLGVRALQTERKEGSGTERYVRKVAYLRVYVYIYITIYINIFIYIYIYVYTLFVNVDLWLTHTLITNVKLYSISRICLSDMYVFSCAKCNLDAQGAPNWK